MKYEKMAEDNGFENYQISSYRTLNFENEYNNSEWIYFLYMFNYGL